MSNWEKYSLMRFIRESENYKNVYIFGRGYCGEYLIRGFQANEVKLTAVLDNNNGVVGGNILQVPIVSPIEMETGADTYVVVSNQDKLNQKAIKDQLISLGLEEKQIAQYYQLLPEELNKFEVPDRSELTRETVDFQFGINTKESLKRYKVGYTQGVFDMFHVGHLALINHAAEQCEKLIVGVNSDSLVQEYKNKTPVINEFNRAEIIRNLKAVDDCIIVETLNKVDVLKQIRFDAIFIGDDWKGNQRWKQTEIDLAEYGVDVVYLPHTPDVSSTVLREEEPNRVTGE